MSSIGYTPIVTKSSNFIHRCLYVIKITLKSCLHVIYWLYTDRFYIVKFRSSLFVIHLVFIFQSFLSFF